MGLIDEDFLTKVGLVVVMLGGGRGGVSRRGVEVEVAALRYGGKRAIGDCDRDFIISGAGDV